MTSTDKIWIAFHQKLLAFIKSRVPEDVAEDLLQDVFLKMHQQIETLRDATRLESWLYRITSNAIADYYRSRPSTEKLPRQLEAAETEEGDLIRQELALCIEPMIDQLPAKYRDAVRLSELEGKSQGEVAALNNISLSGAKSRVQRGRARLKTMLQDCCTIEINRQNQPQSYERNDKDCKYC